jgi:hypothetical protein
MTLIRKRSFWLSSSLAMLGLVSLLSGIWIQIASFRSVSATGSIPSPVQLAVDLGYSQWFIMSGVVMLVVGGSILLLTLLARD